MPKPPSTTRRRLLQGSACLLAAAALPLRAADQPGFGALDLEWADAARERTVPVRLYMPEQATPGRRVPLMVFSHGIGGSRRGYSYLGQHMASHGVASLHLQHVGSDRNLWTGNLFNLVGRLQGAAGEGEAVARARDVHFALDTLLAAPAQQALAARIDTDRILMAGHSYGANTTLLVSGARVERAGQLLSLRDDRVRAAIAISAPPFYGEGDPRRILGGVTVPSLHVTATEDVILIPGYYSAAQDRVEVFDAIGSQRKWLAVFEGGSHSMFTDRAGTGGVVLNPQVKAATKALSLAFLQAVLGDDASALQAWPQQHKAILAQFRAQPPAAA
jgi:predicted dienelactone hydrolase